MPAGSARGARAKGAAYERQLRNFLAEQNLGEVTNPSPSGYEGEDVRVEFADYLCIEAKNHSTMNLSGWLAQAQGQCEEGDIPIVVHKKKGTTDMGKSYVTTDLESFIQLLKKLGNPEEVPTAKHFKSAITKLESALEDLKGQLDD